ncbi:transcription initiation factor TFIID subunit 9 [Pycnococcus provasolii]
MAEQSTPAEPEPRDAAAVRHVLQSMGVETYEPRVVHQLLEFVYRYTSEVVQDAALYAEHAGRKSGDLTAHDARLAAKLWSQRRFAPPPPRAHIDDVASVKNATPLPGVSPTPGVRLPPTHM